MTRVALAVCVFVTFLAFAGTASAFTESQITVPADGSFPTWDRGGPNTIHVEATTNGGTELADLVCFFGPVRRVIATDVQVTAGAVNADVPVLAAAADNPTPYCVLRAIPANDVTNYPPDQPSAFDGPRIGPGIVDTTLVGGTGINKNFVVDYLVGSAQPRGYMESSSAGGCGIDWSFVHDPITFDQSSEFFYCAGWIYARNGCAHAEAGPLCVETNRSELRVDGVDTYFATGARFLYIVSSSQQSSLVTGLPLLTFSRSFDPLNGNVSLSESNQTARCSPNPNAYYSAHNDPAWASDCSSFTPGVVKLDRTGGIDNQGRRATYIDVWSSTDGASHTVDVLYDEEIRGDSGMFPSASFDYSWDSSGFIPPLAGDKIPGPAADVPTTMLIDANAGGTDEFAFPQGAVTFSNSPTEVHWWRSGNGSTYGTFRFVFTVPANGSITVAHSYLQGSEKSEIADQIAGEQARIGRPHVALTSPSTVDRADVVITGTATDPAGGITGLTVNGDAVPVGADGSWSKAMTLNQGENTITATATDTSGNTTTVSPKVTFTPPTPVTTTTTPPPTGAPAAADKVAPTLGLLIARIKLAALFKRGLPVRVSCSEACTFGVTLFLDQKTAKRVGLAAKNVRVGRTTGRLTAKGSKTVRVKLTKKAKRKLAKLSKVPLIVSLSAKDTAGNSSLKSRRVTVRRR